MISVAGAAGLLLGIIIGFFLGFIVVEGERQAEKAANGSNPTKHPNQGGP